MGNAIHEGDTERAEAIAADLDMRRLPMLSDFVDACLYGAG